jgi:hypothetical protein
MVLNIELMAEFCVSSKTGKKHVIFSDLMLWITHNELRFIIKYFYVTLFVLMHHWLCIMDYCENCFVPSFF